MDNNRVYFPVDIENSALAYAHIELFRYVDLSAVRHLLEQCNEVEVEAGDMVLEAGTENNAAYLVIRGELEIRLLEPDAKAIVTVTSGACVGELSILSRLKVTAFAVATKPSRLLVITDALLWEFVATSHEFACNMLAMLSGRVNEDNIRFLHSLDAQHRYQKAAKVDALTGLFNRCWFDEILARQWQRARADDTPLSVLFIDIDHFKSINDLHGHLNADQALRSVANILQASIRPMDLAACFGGEEFAIVMLGITLSEAREIAERLRRDIEHHTISCDNRLVHITVSIGVAELSEGESALECLAGSDAAMYAAKRNGRNCVGVRSADGELCA
jgi:diguanylate cyclase (GGDEF)-like protein